MFKNLEEFQAHRLKMNDPEYIKEFKIKQEEYLMKNWMELKPFVLGTDVPTLPKMNDFYINRLIELGAIPKKDLEDGVWYYGNYRNATLGKWIEAEQKFGHWRYKFGFRWDTCNHFEDDNTFALFVPLRKANKEELVEIKKIEDEKL